MNQFHGNTGLNLGIYLVIASNNRAAKAINNNTLAVD